MTNDNEEPSAASAGSVGEPAAWAVADESGVWFARLRREDADEAFRRAVSFNETFGRLVPLYRSPTLTDAERVALEWAIDWISSSTPNGHCPKELRGLLERTK